MKQHTCINTSNSLNNPIRPNSTNSITDIGLYSEDKRMYSGAIGGSFSELSTMQQDLNKNTHNKEQSQSIFRRWD